MKRSVIVEDFGKIKHAEIEMKPMMMFVGDNNSGKSYLMSLLWGLLSDNSEMLIHLTDEVKNSKLYEKLRIIIIHNTMITENTRV